MTITTFYKNLSSLLLGVCVMTMVTSCGNGISSGGGEAGKDGVQQRKPGNGNSEPVVVEEELGIVGRYEVEFDSLNSSVAGVFLAKSKIQVMGDQFDIEVDVSGSSQMNAPHYQFIYEGTECPSAEIHDTNADGYVDPIEASKVIGKIIVPLDNDLNSQLEGISVFPMTNLFGDYTYSKESSLSSMVSDLQTVDVNPRDEITKLSPGKDLKIEGKVIVIQGFKRELGYLPGSIQTFEGTSAYDTLPIACGKIVRKKNPESGTTGPQ